MPSEKLKPYIKCFKVISPGGDVINRLVPDTCVTLGIRIKGIVNYYDGCEDLLLPATLVTGLRRSYRMIHYHVGSAMLVAMFTNAGAKAFLPRPLIDMFEQTVSLDDLLPATDVDLLQEMICGANTHAERIALLEKFLVNNIIDIKPDMLISSAIYTIIQANGNVHVQKLSKQLYISEDAFTKRFRRFTGTTPKQYAGIIRMKSAIQLVRKGSALTGSALDAGFYDQAHFIRDFKTFTGLTPTALRKGSPLW